MECVNNPRFSVSISALTVPSLKQWHVYCWTVKIALCAEFISLERRLRGGASEVHASEGQWFNLWLQLLIEVSFNTTLTPKLLPVVAMN